MNDEEFKKKLESILENLYRIDREVREYLGRDKIRLKNHEYSAGLSQGYEEKTYAKHTT
jgi:hypothetical protein